MLNLWGCGGSQCDHRADVDLVDDRADAAIFRAEVVTPFGNAVCLVDCVE